MTGTETATTAPTDVAIKAALKYAEGIAANHTRGSETLREIALDSATDAVLWSIKNYQSSAGKFEAFAAAVARTWIPRALARERRRYAASPEYVELFESVPASSRAAHDDGREVQLPLAVQELPDDLQAVVRFFYLDKFTIRECALLLGIGHETARVRLQRAAKYLGGDDEMQRIARSNDKRMTR